MGGRVGDPGEGCAQGSVLRVAVRRGVGEVGWGGDSLSPVNSFDLVLWW